MIYNGFDFSPWFTTKLMTRSLLPGYAVETQDVPYRAGERFMRAKLKPSGARGRPTTWPRCAGRWRRGSCVSRRHRST